MTTTQPRITAVAAFYAQYADALERRVARRVNGASGTAIEDACHTAWTTLLRRPDIHLDDAGLRWLTVVATREAWRLTNLRDLPVGAFMVSTNEEDRDDGVLAEPAADAADPADRALALELHRDRVARFNTLKPAEREALLLHAAGYSYADIGALTGASYTAVNRRLTEGRARLRDDRAR